MDEPAPAEVTQLDRDRWADHCARIYGKDHPDVIAFRAGERDDAAALRMLAAHRLAALEEAARVADRDAEQHRIFEQEARDRMVRQFHKARIGAAEFIAFCIRRFLARSVSENGEPIADPAIRKAKDTSQ